MTIRAVLFDFDGTLTCPGALDFAAIKQDLGCPPDMPILEYLAICPGPERPRLLAILEERENAAAGASVPNAGAETCIGTLRRRGLLLGILTRNSLKSVTRALQGFDRVTLSDFEAIVTRDESPPKPHPGGVLQAGRVMGVQAAEMVVVGDFRFDVLAGHAAGATTVLLTNGTGSPMQPEDPEPHHVIGNLSELPDLLEGLIRVSRGGA